MDIEISKIDILSYKLYCKDVKEVINKFPLLHSSKTTYYNIKAFILYSDFYNDYYKKAKMLLRKEKLNKILNK